MMMNRQNVVAALRRDVSFVGNAVVAVVFVGCRRLGCCVPFCSTWCSFIH